MAADAAGVPALLLAFPFNSRTARGHAPVPEANDSLAAITAASACSLALCERTWLALEAVAAAAPSDVIVGARACGPRRANPATSMAQSHLPGACELRAVSALHPVLAVWTGAVWADAWPSLRRVAAAQLHAPTDSDALLPHLLHAAIFAVTAESLFTHEHDSSCQARRADGVTGVPKNGTQESLQAVAVSVDANLAANGRCECCSSLQQRIDELEARLARLEARQLRW